MKKYHFLYALISIIALFSVSAALFFQYIDNLEPCILCVMQRFVFIALFSIATIAAFHRSTKRLTNIIYSTLLALISILGIGVATRQIWLQHIPMDQRPLCAPNIDFIFNNFLWHEIVVLFFTGSGDCGEITWQLAGISMPAWSLMLFVIIFIMTCFLVRFAVIKK